MNNLIKGSVAGATGIALLTGGFGTYALWSDSVALAPATVSSGDLDIESAGTQLWQDWSPDVLLANGGNPVAWDAVAPNVDLMIPGDVVKLTQPLNVTAVGKNLQVKLSLTGIANTFDNGLTINVAYAGKDTTFTGVGPFELNYLPGDATALTDATSVVVTFHLPSTVGNSPDAGDRDANKTVDLSNVVLHLDQVRS